MQKLFWNYEQINWSLYSVIQCDKILSQCYTMCKPIKVRFCASQVRLLRFVRTDIRFYSGDSTKSINFWKKIDKMNVAVWYSFSIARITNVVNNWSSEQLVQCSACDTQGNKFSLNNNRICKLWISHELPPFSAVKTAQQRQVTTQEKQNIEFVSTGRTLRSSNLTPDTFNSKTPIPTYLNTKTFCAVWNTDHEKII